MPAVADPPRETTAAVDAAAVKRALEIGGRAVVTVRSRKSGEHVTVQFTAKKREPEGRGFVSRATIEGRVGIRDADAVFVDDPTLMWPDGKVATFLPKTGEWKPAKGVDRSRFWAAEKVFAWAHGRYALEESAEVFIELTCCFCGKPLTDPVSIERGIGPDCYGRHTGSKSAARP